MIRSRSQPHQQGHDLSMSVELYTTFSQSRQSNYAGLLVHA